MKSTRKTDTEDGFRHQVKYCGENLYIFTGPKTLSMSMTEMTKDMGRENDPQTLVGLDIISASISLCLVAGVSRGVIASTMFEQSRKEGDIADILSKVLAVK